MEDNRPVLVNRTSFVSPGGGVQGVDTPEDQINVSILGALQDIEALLRRMHRLLAERPAPAPIEPPLAEPLESAPAEEQGGDDTRFKVERDGVVLAEGEMEDWPARYADTGPMEDEGPGGLRLLRFFDPEAPPIGRLLIVSTEAQRGMFIGWARYLAAGGWHVMLYVTEEMIWAHLPERWEDNVDAKALPEEVTAFSAWRDTTKELAAAQGARVLTWARALIEHHEPTAMLVWGHSMFQYRAAALAGYETSVPVVHVEGAFYPRMDKLDPTRRKLAVDKSWMCADVGGCYYEGKGRLFTELPQVLKRPLRPEAEAQVQGYLRAWKQRKASKYGQPGKHPDLVPAGKPTLLVLTQIDKDASLYYTKTLARDSAELLKLLAKTVDREQWQVVVKLHPFDHRHPKDVARGNGFQVVKATELNLHDAFAMADAVVGINSTALFEALAYDKPVVTLGDSWFTGRGMTLDCRTKAKLKKVLEAVPSMPVGAGEKFLRALHFLLWNYFVGFGDRDPIVTALERAGAA